MKRVKSREEAEREEGQPSIKSDVPNNRIQDEQQVSTVMDADKVQAPTQDYKRTEKELPGSELKQEVISKAITGSGGGQGMSINFAGQTRGGARDSGLGQGIMGANSSALQSKQFRDPTRVGKKLDRKATQLNFTPCAVTEIAVRESEPLAAAKDKDQGYNGTYRNTNARSQKVAGAVPGDLMYQRSVDAGYKDQLYYVEGQMVFQNEGDRTSVNPTKVVLPDTVAASADEELADVTYHTGNYVHRALHCGMNSTGKVGYFYFDVDDITPPLQTSEGANSASTHRLRKENMAELDRMIMEAKAGDEKADLWSPLPRAIANPTQASYLMKSIEADTGAYIYLAYAKASTNFSYQLNRARKDGLDVLAPAVEQMVGWRSSCKEQSEFTTAYPTVQSCFDVAAYRKGDPSLMIAAYDSVAKYNDKSDLLLQPKGWRMHLQTADNNMNPLRVPEQFVKLYSANETFASIGHDFDESMPEFMTDKANLVLAHNLNELGAFVKVGGSKTFKSTWTSTELGSDYKYSAKALTPQGYMRALNAITDGEAAVVTYYKVRSGDGYKTGQVPSYNYTSATGELEITWEHMTTVSDADGNREVSFVQFITMGDLPAQHASLIAAGYHCIGEVTSGEPATTSYDDCPYSLADVTSIVYDQPVIQSETGSVVTASDFQESEYVYGDETVYMENCYPFAYCYSDLRNVYTTHVRHPLIHGLIAYLEESKGAKFYSLLRGNELFVPFIFSTEYMTLAQLILCAATPYIVKVRKNSMVDVLYLQDNLKLYPYSGLISLQEAPTKNYVNLGFMGMDEPLEGRIMDPVRAIRWTIPEMFWKLDDSHIVAPFYSNEKELDPATGGVDEDSSVMSYPSIRSGVRLASLDAVYGMSEKDLRLSLDRITRYFYDNEKFTGFSVYKYGRTTDGQIVLKLADHAVLSIGDILSAPRELGLVQEAPLGYLTPDIGDNSGNHFGGVLKSLTDDGTASSLRIKIWRNPKAPMHPEILAASGVNIDRGTNYVQNWAEISCSESDSETDIGGLVFGLNDENGVSYSPFAVLGSGAPDSDMSSVKIISRQRSLHTRLQYLPFVISPFDAKKTSALSDGYDLWELAYIFGLAGFRGSDYRESVYNREKEAVNQGLNFVKDPWIEESPLIREGSRATGLSSAPGYVIAR